jgi:hypothetical protein
MLKRAISSRSGLPLIVSELEYSQSAASVSLSFDKSQLTV